LAIVQKVALTEPTRGLFGSALRLIDHIAKTGMSDPFWTFGGGTVLMLRFQHRRSKDVDIFLPDPQYLGYVNPRLSEVAETITNNFVEDAKFVKLILPKGEIDFVAGPNLLPAEEAFETWNIDGQIVRVETPAEIVAKKMYHRGDIATARDLFDLAIVSRLAPDQIRAAGPFLGRHRDAFLEALRNRKDILEAQFQQIDFIKVDLAFHECVQIAQEILRGS